MYSSTYFLASTHSVFAHRGETLLTRWKTLSANVQMVRLYLVHSSTEKKQTKIFYKRSSPFVSLSSQYKAAQLISTSLFVCFVYPLKAGNVNKSICCCCFFRPFPLLMDSFHGGFNSPTNDVFRSIAPACVCVDDHIENQVNQIYLQVYD